MSWHCTGFSHQLYVCQDNIEMFEAEGNIGESSQSDARQGKVLLRQMIVIENFYSSILDLLYETLIQELWRIWRNEIRIKNIRILEVYTDDKLCQISNIMRINHYYFKHAVVKKRVLKVFKSLGTKIDSKVHVIEKDKKWSNLRQD